MKETSELSREYAEKISPLLEKAQRAYGAKTQNTPAHVASREYTALLVEYAEKGGSLMELATALGVSYSGIRRRVMSAGVPSIRSTMTRRKLTPEELDEAIARVKTAKSHSTDRYHEQLATEYYENGVSLGKIAEGLGISNAAPLYYGVQCHLRRTARPFAR